MYKARAAFGSTSRRRVQRATSAQQPLDPALHCMHWRMPTLAGASTHALQDCTNNMALASPAHVSDMQLSALQNNATTVALLAVDETQRGKLPAYVRKLQVLVLDVSSRCHLAGIALLQAIAHASLHRVPAALGAHSTALCVSLSLSRRQQHHCRVYKVQDKRPHHCQIMTVGWQQQGRGIKETSVLMQQDGLTI